jgi:carboxypeptidase C (cathepsin A)
LSTALLSGAFLIFGIVLGSFLSHALSRSARHEEWLRDAKKQEYKEVLTALATAYLALIRFGTAGTVVPGELERRISDTEAEAYRILHDRVFIAHELESTEISKRWTEATENFARTRDKGYERKFALNHMNLDPQQHAKITLGYYDAGHMMYLRSDSLDRLKQDVSGFLGNALK